MRLTNYIITYLNKNNNKNYIYLKNKRAIMLATVKALIYTNNKIIKVERYNKNKDIKTKINIKECDLS